MVVSTVILDSHKAASQKTGWRVFAAVFAVWFVLLSSAVHGLHRHGGYSYCADAAERGLLEENNSHYETVSTTIKTVVGLDQPSRTGAGLCPVCLFLQNCNERAIVWKSPEPAMPADGHVLRPTQIILPAAIVVLSSPRAPPAPLA
jgi:hypothetical protein